MTAKTSQNSKQATFKGQVVSISDAQTMIVEVVTYKTHPKYRKKYKSSKRYTVDTLGNTYEKGVWVEFVACRPISKSKCFKVK